MWELDKICTPALSKIPTWDRMNENQRAALYDFAYNLGAHFYNAHNFESITLLCDLPDKWSDNAWVFEQFCKYDKAGGIMVPALLERRTKEATLFCTPMEVDA